MMDAYDIAGSALTAQRLRMNVISGNLANANTTRKADGTPGAYRRKNVVFAPILAEESGESGPSLPAGVGRRSDRGDMPLKGSTSGISLAPKGRSVFRTGIQFNEDAGSGDGVQVTAIEEDAKTPLKSVYDPSHPDANALGYVELPNVNVVNEMIDLISASRAYEANVTAFSSFKAIQQAAIEQM